jgi:hypothetical protein
MAEIGGMENWCMDNPKSAAREMAALERRLAESERKATIWRENFDKAILRAATAELRLAESQAEVKRLDALVDAYVERER